MPLRLLNIEITPVHIYTKDLIYDVLKEKDYLLNTGLQEVLDKVDGAFAGTYIKATK